MAMIPGTTNADSFLVFTAHYDHLGRIGKQTLFPGANEDQVEQPTTWSLQNIIHIPENPTCKSLLFIAFAGQQAGLVGSKYYTENPPLPFEQYPDFYIFINWEMVKTVLMVQTVNIFENEFKLLEIINRQQQLLTTIGKRGKAKNSHDYWFSEKESPALSSYTTGGSSDH